MQVIKKSQEFHIPATYLDDNDEIKEQDMDIIKFSNEWNKITENKLYKLHEINGRNYIITHQKSLADFNDDLEKLLIEIGKIELMIDKLDGKESKLKEYKKELDTLTEDIKQQVAKLKELKEKTAKTTEINQKKPNGTGGEYIYYYI